MHHRLPRWRMKFSGLTCRLRDTKLYSRCPLNWEESAHILWKRKLSGTWMTLMKMRVHLLQRVYLKKRRNLKKAIKNNH